MSSRIKTLIVTFAVALLTLTWAASAALGQDLNTDQDIQDGIAIDIRGGIRRATIPLAISPIGGQGGDPSISREIMETLTRDLMISGYFTLIPRDQIFFDLGSDGMTASSINFQNWFNIGASGLVKGTYREASGQVKLDLRLFKVESGVQANLNWKPESVSRIQLRQAVHRFANAVIEHYTGNRGVFGTKIAFAARTKTNEKHIYTMDMDGANLTRVTRNGAINILPSWGRGGVYFTSYQDGNPNLYFWRWGGKPQLVSGHEGLNAGASQCKDKLLVTLSKNGTNTDIYQIHPNTGAIEARLTDHWGIDTSPSWSADCSKVAFVSDRAGSPQIYVMDADGSNQRRLTFEGDYNTSPDWSPRGNSILYTRRGAGNNFDIYSVDLKGYSERLTENQGSNKDPSWSPNGQYIVFTSTRDGGGARIYIMTADGQFQTLITRNGSGYATPVWSR